MSKKAQVNLRILAQVALLIAVEVVLTRFCSIRTSFVTIGFGFVPLAICGMLFGPAWAGVAGGIADFVGATLFPVGPYFPGFTLSMVLTGIVFGLCLHRKEIKWSHIVLSVVINNLGISMFLTTFWIHMLYGAPYWSLMPVRILQNAIIVTAEFVVLNLIKKPVEGYASLTQLS